MIAEFICLFWDVGKNKQRNEQTNKKPVTLQIETYIIFMDQITP